MTSPPQELRFFLCVFVLKLLFLPYDIQIPPLRFGVTRVCFCAGISAKQHIWPSTSSRTNKKPSRKKHGHIARIRLLRNGLESFLLCCKSAAKVKMQWKIFPRILMRCFFYGPRKSPTGPFRTTLKINLFVPNYSPIPIY